MKRVGFDLKDLYFLEFKQFRDAHPELITLPKEVQESRYEFFEKKRQEKIEEIKSVQ
jgi:hypothetical protein